MSEGYYQLALRQTNKENQQQARLNAAPVTVVPVKAAIIKSKGKHEK